ncbi:MAG: transposase, partial [Pseudomonadota bacterium]
MKNNLPKRKTPVHYLPYDNGKKPVIIYVTVCTDKRKKILCGEAGYKLLLKAWNSADSWLVGRYVVMPDHIHLFCSPASVDSPVLGKWVQYWKTLVSREWPKPNEQPVWQKSFWDTQLRSSDRYDEKWQYVCVNPVRAGLCAKSDDWYWQGELNV